MTPAAFFSLFPGALSFQTFDDGPGKRKPLARIMHGTIAQHDDKLRTLNARGAGVFFMVNEGDGRGRKAANVRRVRALFVDLDGSPLEPVEAAPLRPHAIVESSSGRWHAYWRVKDCPLDRFKPLQQALATRFNGDPKVCDLPRVMRVPGFDHRKGEAFRSRVVALADGLPPYAVAEIVEAFGLSVVPGPTRKARVLPGAIPEGGRNETLLSLAAGLVGKGYGLEAVNLRLQRINAERCQPPLCATEVDAIAARAMEYGSGGFVKLPHRLLDSPQWQALTPEAHEIILIAFRRFDGFNNGRIALTWGDFDGRPGIGGRRAFYRHRRSAVASGILRVRAEGRNRQAGRTADLFTIADQWLPAPPVSKNELGPSVQNGHPYIDELSLGVEGSNDAEGAHANRKAA